MITFHIMIYFETFVLMLSHALRRLFFHVLSFAFDIDWLMGFCPFPSADIIDKLTLTFNRTRQAVITKELIEIISGAAAL